MGDLSNCGCNDRCNDRCNNGCGCFGSGRNSGIWWIIILLFFCGGCGNGGSSWGFGSNRCGCDDCDNDNNCCSIIIWIILLSCICGNGSIF